MRTFQKPISKFAPPVQQQMRRIVVNPCVIVDIDIGETRVISETSLVDGMFQGKKYIYHSTRKTAPINKVGRDEKIKNIARNRQSFNDVKWYYEVGHPIFGGVTLDNDSVT